MRGLSDIVQGQFGRGNELELLGVTTPPRGLSDSESNVKTK